MPLWERITCFLILLGPGLSGCGATWNIQDGDGDGVTAAQGDCWDEEEGPTGSGLTGAQIGPNQEETWYDGYDQDCANDDDYDADSDGFVPDEFVGITTSRVDGTGALPGGDCWDNPAQKSIEYTVTSDTMSTGVPYSEIAADEVNPDAEDRWYDGVDQDCAGEDDFDQDGDGYRSAYHEDQYGTAGDDCIDGSPLDDDNPAESDPDEVNPGAEETWYDGTDQDCDTNDCDQDGDGYWYDGLDLGYCADDLEDCDDFDANQVPDETAEELFYNGIDDNCNVATGDEDGDKDGDGFWASDYDEKVEANEDAIDDPMDIPEGQEGDCWDDPDEIPEEMEALHDFDQPDSNEVYPEAEEFYYDGIDQDCAGEDAANNGVEDDFDWDGDGFASALYENRNGDYGDDCIDCPDVYASVPQCIWEDPNPGNVNPMGVNPEGNETYYDGTDQDCDDASDYDADEDGYGIWDEEYEDEIADEGLVLTGDCDDMDDGIHPGSDDDWYSGVDEDCDGRDDYDADEDGYVDDDYAGLETEYIDDSGALPDGDCDDDESRTYPSATEYCDDVDNDCDGTIDGDDAADVVTWYADSDGDGYGDDTTTSIACDAPDDYVIDNTDCDDDEPTTYPGAPEYCDDVDNDCDGTIDGDDVDVVTWYADSDADGYGDSSNTIEACEQPSGYVLKDTDCDDGDSDVNPDATEFCDGFDNDCDGTTDEDDADDVLTWYADEDSDGYGDSSETTEACNQPSGYVSNDEDCDDDESSIYPGSTEYCDGADNDCDGSTDEDDADDVLTWYRDSDSDGYGDGSSTDTDCDQPSGYVSNDEDCDDSESSTYPGATEYCDKIDNDCDDEIDEDDADDETTWYKDSDSDGYGDASSSDTACDQPSGYVSNDEDCDDGESSTYPGATEYCDKIDNDCDDEVDENDADDALTWYKDSDSDGYGDASSSDTGCDQPSGYVSNDTDCDDTDENVSPSGIETCDTSYDDDCDDDANDLNATNCTEYYMDADGDGYGDISDKQCTCKADGDYDVTDDTDCDDLDADISPDATEVCDGEDNDCDDDIDDDDADLDTTTHESWYPDDDADGFGDDGATAVESCDAPSGYVDDATDCDDEDKGINPDETEVCDGEDNDCDSLVDDDDPDAEVFTWYADADLDGYGDADSTTEACDEPSGYTDDDTDCNDLDADINPDVTDVCDGEDNNCSGDVDDDGDCDCDVHTYDGHGYMFCVDDSSWEDALDYCYDYGYHLLTLDDADEGEFVDDMADTYSDDEWWMGLNDHDSEGTFVWEDGTTVSYTNWADDEPNDWGSGEDCTQLNRWDDDTWNDSSCSGDHYFICESW